MKSRKTKSSFLCIDDDANLISLCEAISENGTVTLSPSPPPPSWEEAIDEITVQLTDGRFEGLLLDFRLDEYPIGPRKAKVRYTAESLVNELRRQSVEGGDRSYPIVLWSTTKQLSMYYTINPSYTGLYDGIWDKATALEEAKSYAAVLEALGDGYRRLRVAAGKNQGLHVVLGCDPTAVLLELEQAFASKIKQAPFAFNYATFIINRILKCNGVLFDLGTTAAILGVSDSGAVDHIVTKITTTDAPIKYSGVFAQGYQRFWRDPFLKLLNGLAPGKMWLHLPADVRVALLKKHLRIKNLSPAKPIHASYQTDFDCVCAISGRPLARHDGYRLHSAVQDPWIQPQYVAGTSLRRLTKAEALRWRLDVGEQERFTADFGG